MHKTIITNVTLVNEGQIIEADCIIDGGRIAGIEEKAELSGAHIIDGQGKYLLPGIIDGQVHFRDPGFPHKADFHSESKAALAGGVTSVIDMPNTLPNVLDMDSLRQKEAIVASKSLVNFATLLGINSKNLHLLDQLEPSEHLAVTDDGLYFSGKGNLLADNPAVLEQVFSKSKVLVTIHAEKEAIIEENEERYRKMYGPDIAIAFHPKIRSERACYEASKEAIAIARKHNARLHILHLTTAAETTLFRNDIPLSEKRITTEVCVQNLWFNASDYDHLGTRIKWNPAIKRKQDQEGLLQALLDDRIDLITTDHAPHTMEEKDRPYFESMSGAPMVQHALPIMLAFVREGKISLPKVVEKMCHNPAILYEIKDRGFIRKGYYADLVLVDPKAEWTVSQNNILYKCGWSPLEGTTFTGRVTHTFVNGNLVYEEGRFNEETKGMRLVKK